MREIEIMARLSNAEQFVSLLEQDDIHILDTLTQEDRIYVPRPLPLSEVDAFITPILRIRTENGTTKFTLKKNATVGTDSLNNIEHETVIEDADAMHGALLELGQHVALTVKKMRRTAKFGEYDICIDSVVGLGDFVEVEVLAPSDTDVELARAGMWSFLNRYGLDRSLAVYESYDRQIVRAQNSNSTREEN